MHTSSYKRRMLWRRRMDIKVCKIKNIYAAYMHKCRFGLILRNTLLILKEMALWWCVENVWVWLSVKLAQNVVRRSEYHRKPNWRGNNDIISPRDEPKNNEKAPNHRCSTSSKVVQTAFVPPRHVTQRSSVNNHLSGRHLVWYLH